MTTGFDKDFTESWSLSLNSGTFLWGKKIQLQKQQQLERQGHRSRVPYQGTYRFVLHLETNIYIRLENLKKFLNNITDEKMYTQDSDIPDEYYYFF